ncbi:hypothetical protein AB0C51_18110 [Streptomyces pathocidini]|uniref:hypothetical protein n=1 Tax=Streptomyces pathocidini TaxID=1650571 RepID=UPI0033EA0DE1
MSHAGRAMPHAGGAVAAAAVSAALLTGCGGGEEPADSRPVAAVRLVTPRSLDGGRYVLEKDTAALERAGAGVREGMPPGTTSVLARYRPADDPAGDSGLAFSGAYGRIGEPGRVQDDMFRSFAASSSASVARKRAEYRPRGERGPEVACEVLLVAGDGKPFYAPVCTWARSSDAALVTDIDPGRTSLDAVDVAAFAKVTARIYEDTRRRA